ncbi:MAG: hypothetical protein WBE76_24455 [Terracidiphilus sp.]
MLGTLAFAAFAAEGCNFHPHPDDKAAVYQLLDRNDLSSVEVFESRISGVITLKGDVASADRKARAEAIVRQAAPGYTISNQLRLDNFGVANPPNDTTATARSKDVTLQ